MRLSSTLAFAALLGLATVMSTHTPAQAAETTTASGLRIIDTAPGTGPEPKPGQMVSVNYTGWLYVDGKKGTKFDSSYDRGKPIDFPIGQGRVIPGWRRDPAWRHADLRRRTREGAVIPNARRA